MPNTVPMSRPLRLALLADAVASAATAALLVGGANLLEGFLGLPVALLREAGLILIPYVIVVAVVALRSAAPAGMIVAIIATNAIWTAASLLLLVSGLVAPTMLGIAFVAAQALAVGAFGAIQYVCLKQTAAATA